MGFDLLFLYQTIFSDYYNRCENISTNTSETTNFPACIDLTVTDQYSLVVECGTHPSLVQTVIIKLLIVS